MTSPPDHEATVRRAFEAYRIKDQSLLAPLIAPGFTFTSPYDDAIDEAEYWARCWPNADLIEENMIERVVVAGDSAYATYLARTAGGASFRNTEYFTFADDGRIATIEVYFGASYRDGRFVAKGAE
jgi:ketosteroid isomerase-like protein